MNTMERNAQHIAQTLRQLRKMFRLTQENVATAANISTRTIEKIESGRHTPDEQTLLSIARALGMDVQVFRKSNPEEDARIRKEMAHAVRKMVVVRTTPVRTARDFLVAFEQRHASRCDYSAVQEESALEIAAALVDWIRDLTDVWLDVDETRHLSWARSFAAQCQELEKFGYVCHMGEYRQVLREKGKPDLVFDVTVMAVLPKTEADERYALFELGGNWETLEEDRLTLPEQPAG